MQLWIIALLCQFTDFQEGKKNTVAFCGSKKVKIRVHLVCLVMANLYFCDVGCFILTCFV